MTFWYEWYNEWQRVATRDSEWQGVVTSAISFSSNKHGVIILNRSNKSVFLYLKIYWNRQVFDLIHAWEISIKPETLRHQASSWKFLPWICCNRSKTWRRSLMLKKEYTAWKVSKYGVFPGQNTGKYVTEKTPYLDTFYVVVPWSYDTKQE